jgi:hypothetical protein
MELLRNCPKRNSLLFDDLPTDLLSFLFSFLSPKQLCCLDSAILNHTFRPRFHSALIQRFQMESNFVENTLSLKLRARWYLCRTIPIIALELFDVPCPTEIICEMILTNSNCLKEIGFSRVSLEDRDTLALCECINLKKVKIVRCPGLCVDSTFRNFSSLEDLHLDNVPFSKLTAEIISQHCHSLKSLNLSNLDHVGDEELRILVEGCPSLHILNIYFLQNITEKSVRMLMSHRPQISSIGIKTCYQVRIEGILLLLKEICIPTIFNCDEEESLQISALENLTFALRESYRDFTSVNNFLTSESLLPRLLELLTIKRGMLSSIISFCRVLVENVQSSLVVDVGVVPTLIPHFNSFESSLRMKFIRFLGILFSKTDCGPHLLASGILSIFRPQLLKVNSPPPLSSPPSSH